MKGNGLAGDEINLLGLMREHNRLGAQIMFGTYYGCSN
jgi:hypothetical protein